MHCKALVLNPEVNYLIIGSTAVSYSFFGRSGLLHMINVHCLGSEQKLIECTYSPFLASTHYYCDDGTHAGVKCIGKSITSSWEVFERHVF